MKTRFAPVCGLLLVLLPIGSLQPTTAHAAGKPSIRIISPSPGDTIHSSTVSVHVSVSNFKLVDPVLLGPSKWSSIPLLKGNQGHIHYVLDNLANLVLSRDVVVRTSHTWTNVPPGPHTIIAYLATSQHAPFPGAAPATVHIVVAPTAARQTVRAPVLHPSIQLVASQVQQSPAGTTVYVRVKVSHFKLVPPVYKNPPVLMGNQGHIHYVLDTFSQFIATQDATMKMVHPWRNITPGRHTIIVFLSNSQHQLFPGTAPIKIPIVVPRGKGPGGTSTVQITNLPLTGGAGTASRKASAGGAQPFSILLLACSGILALAAYLRRRTTV